MMSANAGNCCVAPVGRQGKAGGHDRRAGGFIRLASTAPSAVEDVQADFRKRLLKALKIEDCRGQRWYRCVKCFRTCKAEGVPRMARIFAVDGVCDNPPNWRIVVWRRQ